MKIDDVWQSEEQQIIRRRLVRLETMLKEESLDGESSEETLGRLVRQICEYRFFIDKNRAMLLSHGTDIETRPSKPSFAQAWRGYQFKRR